VLHELARAIYVGQAERAGTYPKDVVVDEVLVLDSRLVDPVNISSLHQMVLGDGQAVRAPVHLTGSREYDLHCWVEAAARFEDR
jgi:hypothetical protein